MKPVATVAVSALVGAATAIVAGVLGVDRIGAGDANRMTHATIFLDQVSGSCRIHTAPQTLPGNRRGRVQWTIIDRCGVTNDNDVEISFAEQSPLEASCVPRGRRNITCVVRGDAAYRSYKYNVDARGAVREDPELEIVQ
jgi:hypothetical protein